MIKDDFPESIDAPILWRGEIASTAASLVERVLVRIPEYDSSLLWGPCRWMPRFWPLDIDVSEADESSHLVEILQKLYPTVGDSCLVALDNTREPWIVVWWPYE